MARTYLDFSIPAYSDAVDQTIRQVLIAADYKEKLIIGHNFFKMTKGVYRIRIFRSVYLVVARLKAVNSTDCTLYHNVADFGIKNSRIPFVRRISACQKYHLVKVIF